ncbi:MAG: hypothetical protein KDB88_07990 [Flavobacteriales bacterium]|nr:hypothetical protein [Flavobacteriales bacterium]
MDVFNLALGARVHHPSFGNGAVYDLDDRTVHVFFKEHGEQAISRSFEGLRVVAPGPEPDREEEGLDLDGVKDALREVLEELDVPARPIEMAARFVGGTLELRPADAGLRSKEVPIEDFFHKIVMMRDRFRVLEQKINAHSGLSEQDKVELQQYITRCYGSLTTFNVLFADKEDHFVGQKGG